MTAEDATVTGAAPSILVIDDEDYVADMIAAALHIDGYVVRVAYNGRTGLEQASAEPAALIIVDIMMPYLDGESLAQQLRQMEGTRDVPIVLISAGARPRKALPNVAFLPKPFDMDRLLDVVKERIGAA